MMRALTSAVALSLWAGSAMGSVFYGVTDHTLVRISTSTNSVTTIGNIAAGPTTLSVMADCDFDPSGTLFALRQGQDNSGGFPPPPLNQLYRINITTGAALQIASFGTSAQLNALAYGPTVGTMLSVSQTDGKLASLNLTSGTVTALFANKLLLPGANRVDALAFAPNGTLYGIWNSDTGFGGGYDYRLIRVDTSTGLATQIGAIGVAQQQRYLGLRFDESGTAYTVESNTGTVTTINLTTGAGTAVFTDSQLIGTTGIALQVPAPGAVAGVLGFAGFVLARRRR